MQTEDLNTTEEDVQKTAFVFVVCLALFCDLAWTVYCMLLLCSSHLYWDISVMSLPNLAHVRVEHVCEVFFFSSNCVPATNLCPFSVELSERALISFYFSRCLDSAGLNSVE